MTEEREHWDRISMQAEARFMKKALKEGRAEGMQQGRAEGMQTLDDGLSIQIKLSDIQKKKEQPVGWTLPLSAK